MVTPSEPSPRAPRSRGKTRGANSGEQIMSRTLTKDVHPTDRHSTDGYSTDVLSTDVLSTDVLSTDGLLTGGLSEQQRRELVEKTAYHLAERRNFEPGHELEDWIAAEVIVNGTHERK
jgi:Protein of unknown function (DUF2934)